jgi:hypothetical protein
MSQRALSSIDAHGGLTAAVKAARKQGVHLVRLTDDAYYGQHEAIQFAALEKLKVSPTRSESSRRAEPAVWSVPPLDWMFDGIPALKASEAWQAVAA